LKPEQEWTPLRAGAGVNGLQYVLRGAGTGVNVKVCLGANRKFSTQQ